MSVPEPINELLQSEFLGIQDIVIWLEKYKHLLVQNIKETKCKKWVNFVENGEKPFPCMCSVRESDCIFIETYYELERIAALQQKNNHCKELADTCENIMRLGDKKLAEHWRFNQVAETEALYFEPVLEIYISSKPFKSLKIQLNKSDYKYFFLYKINFYKLRRRISLMSKYFKTKEANESD